MGTSRKDAEYLVIETYTQFAVPLQKLYSMIPSNNRQSQLSKAENDIIAIYRNYCDTLNIENINGNIQEIVSQNLKTDLQILKNDILVETLIETRELAKLFELPIYNKMPSGEISINANYEGNKESEVRIMLYNAVFFINNNINHELIYEKKAVEKINDMMTNKKVQLDNIRRRTGKDSLGYYDTERDIIVIDIDEAFRRGIPDLIDTMTHEGIHATLMNRPSTLKSYIDEEDIAYNAGLHMGNKYRYQNDIPYYRTEWTREEIEEIVKNMLKEMADN